MSLLKRGCSYYFNIRLNRKILRFSLRTKSIEIARLRAANSYLKIKKYQAAGMDYFQIKKLAHQEAEKMHSEWLASHLNHEAASNMYLYDPEDNDNQLEEELLVSLKEKLQ